MKVFLVSCYILCFFTSVVAQPFPSGSRVCFVGNSITNNGEFHHNILLYHLTRYPKENVSFFNCGISGDVTSGILSRMDDDILVHQPTHIVLMIGMNDVKRSLYDEQLTKNADTLSQRENAIVVYKKNLEKIVNFFLSKKLAIILQKPTIYDQTANLPTKNNFGVNDALKECADFIGELAVKYQLQVVDYWTILNKLNQQLQQNDSSATLTSKDRVHPQSTGHLIMAYEFLTAMKASKYVSEIAVSKGGSIQSSTNCELLKTEKKKNTYSFFIREKSLPFPILSQQEFALELVPFQKDFNQEIFKITNLPEGNYALNIDTTFIGNFNAEDLKAGINLAIYNTTPQYQQSLALRNVLVELWKQESNLRSIKFIEYNGDYKKCIDKSSVEAIKAYLTPVFKAKNNDFYMVQLDKYFLNKPLEKQLMDLSVELRRKAYDIAQPVLHVYNLVKK
jgi:lysophospholipase L1-like esterase